ncbi:MAG TPA: DNA polymerase III subunit beta [Candidatus Woesebacteria bacterium]|jgi:DNA polymerase-3 subunit beta|nr:DNA polymerase III subunit beta [Candidatus Shapirobacteria bacterium]HOR01987.1 DNA polymerase III subunit beta [Candidatus Woesebacteria bacterium]
MKLSLLQENLNLALTNVSRFVSSKNQLPILGNILISTDQGRLKLSATNLELSINYWIGAKIDQEGSITIPSKEITEFISYLPTGKIDLSLKENNLLSVSSAKIESDFTTSPATDFPEFPQINPDTVFEIDLDILSQAISQMAFSAATDDTRPILTGILCSFSQNLLTLVSTDGFRLSFKEIKLVNSLNLKTDKPVTFLIPARSLIEVTKLAKTNQKIKIGLTQDEHQVMFVLDDIELVSRLIEGEFPDYKKLIPESYQTKVFINRDEFFQSVKLASVFARESANVVKMNIKNNSVELTANAPQVGQNRIEIETKTEGENLEVAFNYKFLSDFLNVCKSQEILIKLNENLTPVFFHDQSDPSFTHIIMPVRLQD